MRRKREKRGSRGDKTSEREKELMRRKFWT
jgi:hypothetical protein